MKIVCDNCATKYSIADEKVRGKVFKIRCKKCSHVIVVRGGGDGAAAADAGGSPSGDLDDGAEATAIAGSPSGAMPTVSGAPASDAVWHLVVDREQIGPMTPTEVRSKFAAGQVDAETYAWREGFSDWLRLGSIDDFRDLAQNAAAARPAGGSLPGSMSDESTRRTDAADIFASHQAAVPSGEEDNGAADLFGASAPMPEIAGPSSAPHDDPFNAVAAAAGFSAPAASPGLSSAPAPSSPAPSLSMAPGLGGESYEDGGNGAPKLTGQRNENSVLFSLNNLQALATKSPQGSSSASSSGGNGSAAPRPGYASAATEGSGLIDIRAMAQQTLSAAPSPSSSSSAPDLPGLGAPVFSPVVAAPILLPNQSSGMPKWVWGVIGGGVLAVLGIVSLLVVVVMKSKEPTVVAQTPAAVAAPTPAPAVTPTAAPTTPAPAAAIADKAPAAEAKGAATEDASGKHHHGGAVATSEKKEHHGGRESSAGGIPGLSAATAPAREEEAPKPAKKKKGGGDDLDDILNSTGDSAPRPAPRRAVVAADPNLPAQLDKDDVKAGMSSVTGRAKACYNQYHVGGTVLVNVIIGGSGSVSSASPMGVLAGTPTGDCVARAVRSARFKKFSGTPMQIRYPFILP